jgi:hypothetical protein
VNLHRKDIQDCGQTWITRKPKAVGAEVPKHDNLSIFRSRDLFVQWSSPSARGEEASCLIFSNHVGRDLRFSKNESRRQRSTCPCPDQIPDVSIHVSDVLVICSDLTIFVTPRATGSRRAPLFGRRSILRTLDNQFSWETGCGKFFGSHRSCGVFDSSHLFNNFTERKKKGKHS